MKYRFSLGKKLYEVEIPNTATFHSPTQVAIGRKKMEVWIGEQQGEQIRSFFVGNRLYQVELVRDESGYPQGITINDEYCPASLVKIDNLFYYKEKPVSASRSGVVKSFIPGYIKKVFFSVGDQVKANDIVLIHEAMKMENEIRAPRSGMIKAIGVKEGENILANHLLFEIE